MNISIFYFLYVIIGIIYTQIDYSKPIWPLPKQYSLTGNKIELSNNFNIITTSTSESLLKMIEKYKGFIGTGYGSLRSLEIFIETNNEKLNIDTLYNYSLIVNTDTAKIRASTVYGGIYGLETFSQLIENGKLNYSNINIYDEPNYVHRGILIDTGRRFFPVKTVKELLDGMLYNKMNVLHWHLTDWCRVSLESKIFPMLTSVLTDLQAGYYTQEEAIDIVKYAKQRGIRVIPEFDIPGHSKSWGPLSEVGMQFCDDKKFQLYGDENNKTYNILTQYLDEIIPIFIDDMIHFGCDETSNTGKCNKDNFSKLEKLIFNYAYNKGKRPISWEESLYTTESAMKYSIIDAWQKHTGTETINNGYDAIESAERYFYLDHTNQQHQWLDINNINNNNNKLKNKNIIGRFFGGEVSMWTDNYCYIAQCGSSSGIPVGHELYNPKYNNEFHESILSLIFPRTIKAAGSFWRYDSSLSDTSDQFKYYINNQNNRIRNRGINTCPNDCICDELSKCGKKYIK